MKIAYIVSIGKGLESFIYREIDELFKRNANITLFATKYKSNDVFSPKPGWKVERINYLKILGSFFTCFIFYPIKSFLLLITALRSGTIIELLLAYDYALRMKKDKIEYIHCHFGDRKYFIGFYCKKLTKLPLSLTVHAHELYANSNEKFFRYSLNSADKIIAISNKNKEILVNNFHVQSYKIEVIRLSIDLTNFSKFDTIKILIVARYTERKGFIELFHAIKKLDRNDIELITVGFGDLDLNKMAKEFGIESRVTIFNKMDARQLRFFYNSCDIFCLPSKNTITEGSEGIPVALMEAMASEMIIISTKNGSISELVDDILVDEGSIESLIEGINKAISMIACKKSIGIKNREKVMREYSENNIDKLIEYLYD